MTIPIEDRGDLSRHAMFILTRNRLIELASRAITLHGRAPDDFAVIAINVDDPKWHPLVKVLMPNTPDSEWQNYRDQDQLPIARGSIPWETVETLCDILPGIGSIREDKPPAGEVYALVFGDGGCSVYSVPFAPTFKHARRPS